MNQATPDREPVPIILDTDIGEDIDDILVLAVALNSPEFEVLAVTTVDGDTSARSRIARRITGAFGRGEIPVVAGYPRSMPQGDEPVPSLTSVTQNAVAPTEEGLPAGCESAADELIARLAAARPGRAHLLTIGSMTNAGQALVRYPETARNLAAIVTNGGRFAPGRQTTIGWNLRYDPAAVAVVARSEASWVLLSESMGVPGLTVDDVEAIRTRGLETTDAIWTAIQEWRENKTECNAESLPHMADLNTLAWLLGGYLDVRPGRAYIEVGPCGQPASLRVEDAATGPHLLGWSVRPEQHDRLHDLYMQRLLAEPIAKKEKLI